MATSFMKKGRVLFFLFLALLPVLSVLQAQSTGRLKGVVVDAETGDTMPGVNVVVEGTMIGAATDLDGVYHIDRVPVGEYNLVATFIGYSKIKIEQVHVKAGAVVEVSFTMAMEALEGEEVVVTAKAIKNNETLLLRDRQKSAAVSDAVSAESMNQAGSSDAADAMKQVTGASVVDGKYVFIRGLGDRYTSTQLNGAQLPSTDPYKRSAAVDMIPTNLVDNIVVVKSFTPDKPGNFAGGAVDIKTKDFPDYLTLSFSASTSYNPQVNLNSRGPIGYQGGAADWLGYDNGFRANPLPDNTYIPDVGSAGKDLGTARQLDQMTKSFNYVMTPRAMTPNLDQKYALSVGNQIDLLGRPFGFLASLTYMNEYDSYDNGVYRRWTLSSGQAQSLTNGFDVRDTHTSNNVLWGALFKLSYKMHPNHKLSFNGMRNQSGESSARYLAGVYAYDLSESDLFMTSELAYEQRLVQTYQLNGEDIFPSLGGSKINWRVSMGSSDQNDPDRRYFTSFRNNKGLYGIATNTPPYRFYRAMHENRNEFALDYDLPFKQWGGHNSHFKMGVFYGHADREFRERQMEYNQNPTFKYDGNPDQLFGENNVGLIDTTVLVLPSQTFKRYDFGLVIRENFVDGSWYRGNQDISAYYAMLVLPLTKKLRFISGARYERTNMILEHNAKKPRGQIDTQDWLPSVNFVYQLGQNMNVRLAYSKTLARPLFREVAPYASWDFVGGDTYIGNPGLKRTLIENLDLRWEWFSRPGEIYAVSAFYKDFTDPIETVILNLNREIMWKNVDKAMARGVEFEARKTLDGITPALSNFQVGGNLALVKSEVDISEEQLRIIRETRPDAPKRRPFQGQSPFLLNLILTYSNLARGLTSSIYYNVFGERLAVVSIGGTPDVYEQPAHMLNYTLSWKFAGKMRLNFKAKNLLDSRLQKLQRFNGVDYVYEQHYRGREFSLGLKYEL